MAADGATDLLIPGRLPQQFAIHLKHSDAVTISLACRSNVFGRPGGVRTIKGLLPGTQCIPTVRRSKTQLIDGGTRRRCIFLIRG